MEKEAYLSIIKGEANNLANSILPNDVGTITRHKFLFCLDKIGEIAFNNGREYALKNLLTVEQVAEIIGVSKRRMRAIAKNRHERFGTGWQVPGTNSWLFTPEEIDILKPR